MKRNTSQIKKSKKVKPKTCSKKQWLGIDLSLNKIITELEQVRNALKKTPNNPLLKFEEKMFEAIKKIKEIDTHAPMSILKKNYREFTREVAKRYELFLLVNGLRTQKLPRKEIAFKYLEKYRNYELFSQVEEKLKEYYFLK